MYKQPAGMDYVVSENPVVIPRRDRVFYARPNIYIYFIADNIYKSRIFASSNIYREKNERFIIKSLSFSP